MPHREDAEALWETRISSARARRNGPEVCTGPFSFVLAKDALRHIRENSLRSNASLPTVEREEQEQAYPRLQQAI